MRVTLLFTEMSTLGDFLSANTSAAVRLGRGRRGFETGAAVTATSAFMSAWKRLFAGSAAGHVFASTGDTFHLRVASNAHHVHQVMAWGALAVVALVMVRVPTRTLQLAGLVAGRREGAAR